MNEINIGIQVKTLYKFVSVRPSDGRKTELTGWCGNTLLTSGRNQLSQLTQWRDAVHVGTDATAPDAGQTGLLGFVAATNNREEDVWGAQSTTPYYGWYRQRFRFLPGEVTGNISEVGLGWDTTPGNIAFRALLEDVTGTQVTVTPLPDEYLDVWCEIRYYPPLTDKTGTVVLNGVTYDYILRAAQVTSSTFWGINNGTRIRHLDLFSSYWQAYDDDISTIDQAPNGVQYQADGTNAYDIAYNNNSYQAKMAQIGGPNAWNATTGKKLRSFRVVTTAGAYQIQFDSQAVPGQGIPKTDQFNLKFQFVLSWSEAGPIFSGPVADQNWSQSVAITPLDISTYFQPELPEPTTYSITAGSLPAGLSLDTDTGIISGTPTTVSSGTLEIKCSNEVGEDTTNEFAWTVS